MRLPLTPGRKRVPAFKERLRTLGDDTERVHELSGPHRLMSD